MPEDNSSVFVMYAWQYYPDEKKFPDNRELVHRLIKDLRKCGFDVHSDQTTSKMLSSHTVKEAEKIAAGASNSTDYVILGCSPSLKAKYEIDAPAVVKEELDLLMARKKEEPDSIVQVLVSGNINNAIPTFMGKNRVVGYLESDYYTTFFEILKKLSENFSSNYKKRLLLQSKLFLKKYNALVKNGLSKEGAVLLKEKRSVLEREKRLEEAHAVQSGKDHVARKEQKLSDKAALLKDSKKKARE